MSVHISQKLTLTTAADGTASGVSDPIGGNLHAIVYVKTDFATGVDFTITDTVTGATLWTEINQDATITDYPRALGQAVAGTDLTGWYVQIPVLGTITVAIANGGASKSGTFYFVYDR